MATRIKSYAHAYKQLRRGHKAWCTDPTRDPSTTRHSQSSMKNSCYILPWFTHHVLASGTPTSRRRANEASGHGERREILRPLAKFGPLIQHHNTNVASSGFADQTPLNEDWSKSFVQSTLSRRFDWILF